MPDNKHKNKIQSNTWIKFLSQLTFSKFSPVILFTQQQVNCIWRWVVVNEAAYQNKHHHNDHHCTAISACTGEMFLCVIVSYTGGVQRGEFIDYYWSWVTLFSCQYKEMLQWVAKLSLMDVNIPEWTARVNAMCIVALTGQCNTAKKIPCSSKS